MDFHAWYEFFTGAGLGPNTSSKYAHIFSTNKLERSHLPHLNREVLGELNISIMGHILMILKHARLVSAQNWPLGVRSPPPPTDLSEEEVDDQLEPPPVSEHPTTSHQDSETQTTSVQSTSVAESTSVTDTQELELLSSVAALRGAEIAVQHPASGAEETIEMEGSEISSLNSGNCEMSSSYNSQQCQDKVKQENAVTSEKTLNGDGDEDSSEAPLLPTPAMPHNWLDPSRKPSDSGNESEGVGSESSDVDEEKYSTLQIKNENDETETDSKEVPSVIPEQISSPLLPTPVMPQNWFDPCKKLDDNSDDQSSHSLEPMENDNKNVPVSSFESETNVILDANYLSSTSCPTFMEQPGSQTSLFFSGANMDRLNNPPDLDSPGDSFGQYSEEPIQQRNFQPKINPQLKKQARHTPYHRPQAESTSGVNNYTSNQNERDSAPETMSTSSSFTHNSQPAGDTKETHK